MDQAQVEQASPPRGEEQRHVAVSDTVTPQYGGKSCSTTCAWRPFTLSWSTPTPLRLLGCVNNGWRRSQWSSSKNMTAPSPPAVSSWRRITARWISPWARGARSPASGHRHVRAAGPPDQGRGRPLASRLSLRLCRRADGDQAAGREFGRIRVRDRRPAGPGLTVPSL
jgi:hypothetical protein